MRKLKPHIPGPWLASCYLDGNDEWGILTDNNEIVVVASTKHLIENIKPMAAMPELLAACKSMLATCGSSDVWNGETRESLQLIEAAILKARSHG